MAKKLYYKIGEACKILDIQPYVLRYWEKEFPLLSPSKSSSGQRAYSEAEIEVIRRIKELLYEEGYTIAGAKKKLEGDAAADPESPPAAKAAGSKSRGERSAAKVDNQTAEALKAMRSGVAEALSQAREILRRLEAVAP